MIVELPVTNAWKSYSFSTVLDGASYILQFDHNWRSDGWVMSIMSASNKPLVMGVPILTDVDTVSHYRVKGLPPGGFVAIDETGEHRNPTLETFGTEVKLIYAELEDLV